jgi:hypothetical protein
MAKALLAPEAVIGADGVAVADGWTTLLEVPTAVVGTPAALEVVATVPLLYTGVEITGALEAGATTEVLVTGWTTVQGQLVMVKVVEAVAVYVMPLNEISVEAGHTVV